MYREYPRIPIDVFYTPHAYSRAIKMAEKIGGMRNEFFLIPVGTMILHRPHSSLIPVSVDNTKAFLVYDYIIPEQQIHEGGHTGIIFQVRSAVSRVIEGEVRKFRKKISPTLGVFLKTHCHPFSGGRFLSLGDIDTHWRGANFKQWCDDRGMSFVPMQVIWPVEDGGWNITTFIQKDEKIFITNPPRIVCPGSPILLSLKRPWWSNRFAKAEVLRNVKPLLSKTQDRGKIILHDFGRGWFGVVGKNILYVFPPELDMDTEIHIFSGNQWCFHSHRSTQELIHERKKTFKLFIKP